MKIWFALGIGIALGAAVALLIPRPKSEPPHPHDEEQAHAHEEEDIVRLTDEARKSAGLRTVECRRQNLTAVLTATATVRPNSDRLAHVGAKVTGRIAQAPALEGAQVKAGDTLLALDSIEVGAAALDFLKARSASEVSKANFEREEQLMSKNLTTAEAFYAAKGAHLQAQAERQAARDKLLLLGWTAERVDALAWDDGGDRGRIAVQAPIDGEIIEKHATLGEVVTPETNLFTIADLATVWLMIDVYQGDVGRVRAGCPVEASASGHPGRVFKGRVTYVGKVVDEATRTFKVRVSLDNADKQLLPGMFVTARLHCEVEGAEDVVAVPASAVQRVTDVPGVFVEESPGVYRKRALTLGRRVGEFHEVLVGLKGGETIVTEGSFILKAELLRSRMGHGHEH